MAWSKVKNIILVMLLGVNLILLGMVGWREYQSARYDAQTLEAAVELLRSNGISVDIQLPQARYLPTLRLDGSTPQDERDLRDGLAALLGEDQWTQGSTLTGERGRAELGGDGSFSLAFTPGAWSAADDPGGQAEQVLAQLGITAAAAGVQTQGSLQFFTYWQSWDGVPVFSCPCTLTFEEGSLRAVSGRRLAGEAASLSTEEALSIPTVLVRFLAGMQQNGYVCSAVTGMTLGYSTASSAGRLMPVWAIETDTGICYVNAVTGAFFLEDG